jgi:hypothetical protein
MAMKQPARRSKVDVFTVAEQETGPARKLHGRKASITMPLPPNQIEGRMPSGPRKFARGQDDGVGPSTYHA